jgi:Tol biopolymer transport system component
MGNARLAVLDIITGKVTRPISDAAVSSVEPAWLPDGSAILHASSKTGAAANDPFALPGIYRTQWPAGTTTLITNPPPGTRDSWPQPEADGKNFLYIRYRTDTKQGEVHLSGIDGKLDGPVIAAIDLSPAIQPLGPYWPAVLAYTP